MELTIKFKIPGCGDTCPFYFYKERHDHCTLLGKIDKDIETNAGKFYEGCKLKKLVQGISSSSFGS